MQEQDPYILYSNASPEKVGEDLKTLLNFQDEGLPLDELSKLIEETLIPHFTKYDRPEFHSLYNYYPEAGAELGGRVALQYNQGVTNWQVSPGAVMVEEMCGQVLCRIFDLSDDADATFMYCGTYANQQALYMALHRKAELEGFDYSQDGLLGFKDPSRLALICSHDAHFSLNHALRLMGLGETNLFTVPVDCNRRMVEAELENVVRSTIKDGKDIFCIVSTSGTTSTGSIDPIVPVVELSKEVGAWSHIDAAFGLGFRLIPEMWDRFNGIEHADTVSWDPHKAFGVPIPNSILFVNKKDEFKRVAIYGDYFNREDDPEPNPGIKSIPTTRPFSALPLVTSIRHQGLKGVAKRLRAPIRAIRNLADTVRDNPDIELCHEPDLGLLCMRIVPDGLNPEKQDDLQRYIYKTLRNGGVRQVSMSRLDGKAVLRFVAIAPCVTTEAMLETVEEARRLANTFLL